MRLHGAADGSLFDALSIGPPEMMYKVDRFVNCTRELAEKLTDTSALSRSFYNDLWHGGI